MFCFSFFPKFKTLKKKENEMSEVDQTLAAVESFFKKASIDAADLAFRVVKSPEIVDRITLEEVGNIMNSALNDLGNFRNSIKATVGAIRQRGN